MCCFSRSVIEVTGTRIFARAMEGNEQALVYSLKLAADEALAMILPLPVPPNGPEDAVRFVDLSAYPKIFDDLQKAFPAPAALSFGGPVTRGFQPQAKRLEVHTVGDFEASFVPRLADFSRLDPRFRLADGVFDALPQYRDYGFAVFQMKDFGKGIVDKVKGLFARPTTPASEVHPMAFVFPRRDPSQLFFPTVHVHDGAVHAEAHFSHTLYAQIAPDVPEIAGWWKGNLPNDVDLVRAQGLVRGDWNLRQRGMHGNLPNRDTYL